MNFVVPKFVFRLLFSSLLLLLPILCDCKPKKKRKTRKKKKLFKITTIHFGGRKVGIADYVL